MKVLYLDNHLLIVDKPSGIPTQETKKHLDALEIRCKEWIKKKFHKKGNVFLMPIHRLDKDVCGIVCFARTSKALERLNKAMRNREITKIYYAEIEGHLSHKRGSLVHHLVHGSHKAHVAAEGKRAELYYEVIEETNVSTFVKIELHTGRYHQIRAQFSEIGHPIVGDQKYGSHVALGALKLCHGMLTFEHPITKKFMTFKSSFIKIGYSYD